MNIIRIVFFVLFVKLNTSSLQASSIWARGDNADVFLQNTQKGNSLKKCWIPDGIDTYKLVGLTGSTLLYDEPAWNATIGPSVPRRATEISRTIIPYVIRTHQDLQRYQYLSFIIHVTQTCINEKHWITTNPVIHGNLQEGKFYRPGRVVAYFPNPNMNFLQQDLDQVYLGIFLKYEKRGDSWGFWIADQGWRKDSVIRKHFIASNNLQGKYNAKNWRILEYTGGC